MSGGYRRATRKHPARIDHIDGQSASGFVLVPLGTDFATTLSQAGAFLPFELDTGELAYVSMRAIKRVIPLDEREAGGEEDSRAEAADRVHARREAENGYRRKAQDEAGQAEAGPGAGARSDGGPRKAARSPYISEEQRDALEILGIDETASKADVQAAYRKLVKLYHPDRLRGLGVPQKKIDFAAARLAEVNDAYRILIAVAPAA